MVTPRTAAFDDGCRHLRDAHIYVESVSEVESPVAKCVTPSPRQRSRGGNMFKVRIPPSLRAIQCRSFPSALGTPKSVVSRPESRSPRKEHVEAIEQSYLPLESFAWCDAGDPDFSNVWEIREGSRGYASPSGTWLHAIVRDGVILDRRTMSPSRLNNIWLPCRVDEINNDHEILVVSILGQGATTHVGSKMVLRRFNFRYLHESDEVYYRLLKIALQRREECENRLRIHYHILYDKHCWNDRHFSLPQWIMEDVLRMLGFQPGNVLRLAGNALSSPPARELCFREFILDDERKNVVCSEDGVWPRGKVRQMDESALDLLHQVHWFCSYSQIFQYLARAHPWQKDCGRIHDRSVLDGRRHAIASVRDVCGHLQKHALIGNGQCLKICQQMRRRFLLSSSEDVLVELDALTPNDKSQKGVCISRHAYRKLLPVAPDILTFAHYERRSVRLQEAKDNCLQCIALDISTLLTELQEYDVKFCTRGIDIGNRIMGYCCEEIIEQSLRDYSEFWSLWIQPEVIQRETEMIQTMEQIALFSVFTSPLLLLQLVVDNNRIASAPKVDDMIEDFTNVVGETIRAFKEDGFDLAEAIKACGTYGGPLPRHGAPIEPTWIPFENLHATLHRAFAPIQALVDRFACFQWVLDVNPATFVAEVVMEVRNMEPEGRPGFEAECIREEQRQAGTEDGGVHEPLPVHDAQERLFATEKEHAALTEKLALLRTTHEKITHLVVPNVLNTSLCQIDCRCVTQALTDAITSLIRAITDFWCEEALELSKFASAAYGRYIALLSPEPSNIEELTHLEQWVNGDLRSVMHRLANRWYFLTGSILTRLADNNVSADDALEAYWKLYVPQPTQFSHFVNKRIREFKVLGRKLGDMLKEEEVCFLDDIMVAANMVKTLRKVGPSGTDMDVKMVDDSFDRVEKVSLEMTRLTEVRASLRTRQGMLGMHVGHYPECDNLALSLEPFVTLWTALQQATSTELQWLEGHVLSRSTDLYDDMGQSINSWREIATNPALDEALAHMPEPANALAWMVDFVQVCENYVPVVTKLRHPAFTPKHWNLLLNNLQTLGSLAHLDPVRAATFSHMDTIRLRDIVDTGFTRDLDVIEALKETASLAVREYEEQSEMGTGFDAILLERWMQLHNVPLGRSLFRNKLSDVSVQHLFPSDAQEELPSPLTTQNTASRAIRLKATVSETRWGEFHRLCYEDRQGDLSVREPAPVAETCEDSEAAVLGRFLRHPVCIHPAPVMMGQSRLITTHEGPIDADSILVGLQWAWASSRKDFRVWYDSTRRSGKLEFVGGYIFWQPHTRTRTIKTYGGISVGIAEEEGPFPQCILSLTQRAMDPMHSANLAHVASNLLSRLTTHHILFSPSPGGSIAISLSSTALESLGLSVIPPHLFPTYVAETNPTDLTVIHQVDLTEPEMGPNQLRFGPFRLGDTIVCTMEEGRVVWPDTSMSALVCRRKNGLMECALTLPCEEENAAVKIGIIEYATGHITWDNGDVWIPA